MKNYELECLDKKQIESLSANLSKDNEYITETAGFVPLEVKLRRFEENGQIMQFSQSEFTSSDLRELYLSPEFEITPDMDYEEIQEVQQRRIEYVNEIKKRVSQGNNDNAGTVQPEKNSNVKPEVVSNPSNSEA